MEQHIVDIYLGRIKRHTKAGNNAEAIRILEDLKNYLLGQTANTMQEEYDKTKETSSSCIEDDDPIHPSHYQSFYKDGIDCLTAMRHAFGETAVSHFMICNAFKYIYRHSSKGGFQDIDKAIEYMELYKKNGIIDLGA